MVKFVIAISFCFSRPNNFWLTAVHMDCPFNIHIKHTQRLRRALAEQLHNISGKVTHEIIVGRAGIEN